MKFDLVVTRHEALLEYLIENGMVDESTEVRKHAQAKHVIGKHVCGVLPHSLSCLAASFTEIPLALTPDLRGLELNLEVIRAIAQPPVTYCVTRVEG